MMINLPVRWMMLNVWRDRSRITQNEVAASVDRHDGRMPAILTKEAQEAWLHGTAPLHFKAAFACLVPCRDELTGLLTAAHLVSARVNNTKNHDAGLVAEAEAA